MLHAWLCGGWWMMGGVYVSCTPSLRQLHAKMPPGSMRTLPGKLVY